MSTTPDAVPAHDPARRTDPVDPAPVDPARRRRLLTLLALLAVVVLAVDQVTKVWAVATLTEGRRTELVGDLLGLTLLYNPGAALSIATGMTWVLTVVAVGVVVVTLRASRRIGSRGWAVGLGLLLGGAIGNLADRFLREPGPARGHVVDFIAYGELFVGNVADIAIVAAAGLIMLLALRGVGLDGTREHDPRPRGATDDAAPRDPAPAAAPEAAATDPADDVAGRGRADGAATQDRLRG
ncbi:signal peptidase II [uncultured Cellulomonas sp.]|uniref:signal peptidase II n=1 Tax=uncultured Cellulomonas sp. TaxID=189682 RepID=UPI0026142478|nr:signal peptidase II [uncultured Cellulomonas sp.]